MSNPRLTELADKLHNAVHSGTIDFEGVDQVIAELRKQDAPAKVEPAKPAASPLPFAPGSLSPHP